jgi:mycofactocin system creatininase family protein
VTGALAAAPWPEVEQRGRSVLLVPLGAFEQHGPHLPLDTDTRIAAAVAAGAARSCPGAAVAPAIPYGASGEHADFPGTLSIGTEALGRLLVELGRHAALTWPAVLFVNAHGGNVEALASAVATLAAEGRRCGGHHVTAPGGDAHAGRTETALMLHLAPQDVRLEVAEAGNTAPLATLLPRLRSEGVRAVSPNGVLGDPAGADAGEGARLLETMAGRCVRAAAALLEAHA